MQQTARQCNALMTCQIVKAIAKNIQIWRKECGMEEMSPNTRPRIRGENKKNVLKIKKWDRKVQIKNRETKEIKKDSWNLHIRSEKMYLYLYCQQKQRWPNSPLISCGGELFRQQYSRSRSQAIRNQNWRIRGVFHLRWNVCWKSNKEYEAEVQRGT